MALGEGPLAAKGSPQLFGKSFAFLFGLCTASLPESVKFPGINAHSVDMREVGDPSGFLRDDPPEIEILWDKVRTGPRCRSDEFVGKVEKPTDRQFLPLPVGRPRKLLMLK